jgi:hypothetical protein
MRPLLLPHVRRLWRDGRTLQLGTDPRVAIMLELADPIAVRVLDLLDGTRTERTVIAEATSFGVPEQDAQAVIDALRRGGLLVGSHSLLPRGLPESWRDRLERESGALALSRLAGRSPTTWPNRTPADVLRRRAAAHVLVAGHAWLGGVIASALAQSGVRNLDPAFEGWTMPSDAMVGGLLPGDANRSRASAAADAVRRAAPETRIASLRAGSANFVVRVGARPALALATRGARERASPRLDVHLRDAVVVVGPLVVPFGSPCGHCLNLHRRDRDDAWPVLAAQLATGRDSIEPCAVTTALAGAAFAAAEVLAYIDGRPVRTHGATVEIAGPGTARRRSWTVHPECDCSRRRRRVSGVAADSE